jgi:hypothetical protein
MTVDDTLFSLDARSLIDVLVVTLEQRVVTDYWIVIDGERFDACDVRDSLADVIEQGGSYMTDARMVTALKKLGVIEYGGHPSGMSAVEGPNYACFMARLREQLAGADTA